MKRYETSYFFREGIRGIFLHGFMSFAAVGVIVACLLIMGSFSLLALNLDNMIQELQNNNEVLVVLDETMTSDEAKQFGTDLAKNEAIMRNVQSAELISRDEALEVFSGKVDPETNFLLGFGDDNPLRDRYRVQIMDADLMQETIDALELLPGVAVVHARLDIVEDLGQIRDTVNTICLLLIVILMAVSIFIISNTIKLATFDRREEIAVMRMVGATKRFIRWPFVIEGFMLGLLGSIVAFFLQWRLYDVFAGFLARMVGRIPMIHALNVGDVLLPVLAIFLLAGFLAGIGGSVLTIRKFLRV
ncbi:MAG: permease-like cell division protein FtsX [Oscillospiraceae bacterium]|nr:permease-like cell division protein FtsX [Oscillospiraceae bacterium]